MMSNLASLKLKETLNFFNKKEFLLLLLYGLFSLTPVISQESGQSIIKKPIIEKYSLSDFYDFNNEKLAKKVDEIFESLTDEEKIGQMFIQVAGKLGVPDKEIRQHIKKKQLGGIVFLKGHKEELKKKIKELDSITAQEKSLPLIYSSDGEPALINKKIEGLIKIKSTNEIKTKKEADSIATIIANIFKDIGLHVNYAPTCDLAYNKEIIDKRSFGDDKEKVKELSFAFMKALQSNEIVATAKHFPGHGIPSGDTHKEKVYIKGELEELEIFKELIKEGIISIMIGHLIITDNEKYSSDSLPASVSKKIITDLLRNELGFQGIIITDGMRMKAVIDIKNSAYEAIKAGADMILSPFNIEKTISMILKEIEKDPDLKKQVFDSIKRIIRLKVCLNLI